ncbi:MAG: hypothetical protein HYY08_00085 [Firmicutes bacterium]|nr:hypothetical protein [Bacillota bacterium]
MDVVITTNSPGEVAAWVRPFVRSLLDLEPLARVSVFIPPCDFASGSEKSVVEEIPGVDVVASPREYLLYILLGLRPTGFSPGPRGAVVFLGGDLLHAVLLKRRLRYPALAYTEGRAGWAGSFARFFVPHEAARQKALAKGGAPEKLEVIGDLMLDAVLPELPEASLRASLGFAGGRPLVALFPGSRPREFRHVLPFFLRAAEIIATDIQGVQFALSISPFVSDEHLLEASNGSAGVLEGCAYRVEQRSGPHGLSNLEVVTDKGTRVPVFRNLQYDIMKAADLALVIPGSTTAEMAFLGLPMVVAAPVNKPELVPLEGLVGLVGRVPLLGRRVKAQALKRYVSLNRFCAHPNIRAGREMVPEVRGVLIPEDVAVAAVPLWRDGNRRRKLASELKAVMGEAGAGRMLAQATVRLARGEAL